MRRPADLAYGVDDRPPPAVLLSTALQQTTVILVLTYPAILLAQQTGASVPEAAALLSLTVLVCGAGTAVQALRGGVGAGYLGAVTTAAAYLPPSLLAAQLGGLPLVAGMTLAGGVATVLLARVLQRLRVLMPPEIVGVVVLVIGLGVGLTGIRGLLRMDAGGPPAAAELAVALATLAVAGALGVWGRGVLRWACVLFAMAAGSLFAAALGVPGAAPGFETAALPLVGLPRLGHGGYAFDLALLPAFLVAALVCALKTVGLVATLQKTNDADWVRPEPRSIAGGVTGDGIATMLAGLVAAPAVNMSPTAVAIQTAAGVTSRVAAIGVGALCLLLACFPRGAALLAQVPVPVIAGVLVHAGGLMVVNGMQLTTSRMLDARRSLVVGLAVLATLGAEVTPELAAWVPPSLRPLVAPTAFGTLVALGLNVLMRIGVRKKVSLVVPADAIEEKAVADFASRAGASWGARPDVVARSSELVSWCLDAIVQAGLARGDITVSLAFDEFRLDVLIAYAGAPIELAAAPPSPEELLEDDDAAARLAGHMIRRRSSRANVRHRDGMTELRIAVDH